MKTLTHRGDEMTPTGSRIVTVDKPLEMKVNTFKFPALITPQGKSAHHGANLKIVTTNRDQHLFLFGRERRQQVVTRVRSVMDIIRVPPEPDGWSRRRRRTGVPARCR